MTAKRTSAKKAPSPVPIDHITQAILILRGQRVLLDSDLAELYGISTKALNQAIKRNAARFPEDFMFRLTKAEATELNRSQFVTGSQKHRDLRFPPFAFTEHGAIMAATVLNSSRAVDISIYVVRAFIQLRLMLASNTELSQKLTELERKVSTHDQAITEIIKTIRQLMAQPEPNKRPIGFVELQEKKGNN